MFGAYNNKLKKIYFCVKEINNENEAFNNTMMMIIIVI